MGGCCCSLQEIQAGSTAAKSGQSWEMKEMVLQPIREAGCSRQCWAPSTSKSRYLPGAWRCQELVQLMSPQQQPVLWSALHKCVTEPAAGVAKLMSACCPVFSASERSPSLDIASKRADSLPALPLRTGEPVTVHVSARCKAGIHCHIHKPDPIPDKASQVLTAVAAYRVPKA